MSSINGDKAKHHVLRKMKIQRRIRTRALFLALQTDPAATRGTHPTTRKPAVSPAAGKGNKNV